ncbi:MAG TPA: DUF4282 domain-containing protein [Candidatus Hydrogenedentes bacterium]|nr:DUF4282 domain-containing protein [Candidatus Hydrogenedentota bacterium]HNT87298.1 DUF4282 domain-containing protein [Candidatus Hydrogenedentota bacterium]
MEDFLSFRKMLTPIIIQVVFWIGVVVCVIGGLGAIIAGSGVAGLFMLVLGPVLVRIYAELLILLFKMNDTLTDIKNAVESQARSSGSPLA